MLKGGGGLQRWWQWAMTWATMVEVDCGQWQATRWVTTWTMTWMTTMAGLRRMMVGLMADNGKGGVDDGVALLVWS
jgi:hypothetical protein